MEMAAEKKLRRRYPELAAKQPEAQAEIKRLQQARRQEAQQKPRHRDRSSGIEF